MDQKIENIKGFIISILFWIMVLFVTNKYAKIAGIVLCVILFSTRYWEFLINVIKKEKSDEIESKSESNTLDKTSKDNL